MASKSVYLYRTGDIDERVPFPNSTDDHPRGRVVRLVNGPRDGQRHVPDGCTVGEKLARRYPDRIVEIAEADLPGGDYCQVGRCRWGNRADIHRDALSGWAKASRLLRAGHDAVVADDRAGLAAAAHDLAAIVRELWVRTDWADRALAEWHALLRGGRDATAAVFLRTVARAEVHPDRRVDTGGPFAAARAVHALWSTYDNDADRGRVIAGWVADNDVDADVVASWTGRWDADVDDLVAVGRAAGWVVVALPWDRPELLERAARVLNDGAGDSSLTVVALPAAVADHAERPLAVLHGPCGADEAVHVAAVASTVKAATSGIEPADAVSLAVRAA